MMGQFKSTAKDSARLFWGGLTVGAPIIVIGVNP